MKKIVLVVGFLVFIVSVVLFSILNTSKTTKIFDKTNLSYLDLAQTDKSLSNNVNSGAIFNEEPHKEKNKDTFALIGQVEKDLSYNLFPYTKPANVREKLKLENHQSLLGTGKEIRQLFSKLREKDSDVDLSIFDIKTWGDTLYRDAILARLLNEKLEESDREILANELQSIDSEPNLDLLAQYMPTSGRYYSNSLHTLLSEIYRQDQSSSFSKMNTTQVQKIYELLKQRKRYSDNYYKTIMRDYLMDDSISVQSKIEYMLPFGEAGDDSLVNYGVGYLDSISKQKNLSRVERELIRTLKNKQN